MSNCAFRWELAFRTIGVDVEAQTSSGVVDAIEDGNFILAEALVQSHVDALHRKMPYPQAAILCFTHYPLIHDAFQKVLGPKTKIFPQTRLVTESLMDSL